MMELELPGKEVGAAVVLKVGVQRPEGTNQSHVPDLSFSQALNWALRKQEMWIRGHPR